MANNSNSHKVQITTPNEEHFDSSLDLNLIQLLRRKEEPTKRIMCIQVNWSMWDHPTLPLNGHILTIYLELSPFMGRGWDGLPNVNAKMKIFMHFHEPGFLTMATIVG
jgi:hypothetical protein